MIDYKKRIEDLLTTNIEHDGSYIPASAILKKIPEIEALLHQVEAETESKYEDIFKWLLGENGDFPKSEPGKRYGFRTELRQRLAAHREES